jgi:iron complex transport system ATP-binding protein
VSLEIAPGEVLAVLGENGAGKTTLLRALAGERAPTSGSVALDGRRLQHWKPRALAARRAVLPQDTSIAFRFTALETVLIGRYAFVRGDARTHDVAIARAALAKVDAAHLEARTVTELSGGERARVQLARVLAQLWEPVAGQPRFLLLDEPTASLDARHQLDVLALTRELAHAQGFGVLVVLHDLNLAARAADRVVLMKDGRIEAQGNPQAVFTATQLARCFGVEALVLPHPRRAHPYVVMA